MKDYENKQYYEQSQFHVVFKNSDQEWVSAKLAHSKNGAVNLESCRLMRHQRAFLQQTHAAEAQKTFKKTFILLFTLLFISS